MTNIMYFHFHEISTAGKSIEAESKLVVIRGWEGAGVRRGMGGNYLMGRGYYFGVMKILWN